VRRNPYPHKFHVSTSLPEYVRQYGGLEAGEQLKDTRVSVAGAVRGGNAPHVYDTFSSHTMHGTVSNNHIADPHA